MRLIPRFLATSLLLSTFNIQNAQAALTSYTSGGENLVYSSVSNVTWTSDANLLRTMINEQGYNNLVSSIIATNPIILNNPNWLDTPANSGIHTVTPQDFSNEVYGHATWFGAQAFMGYLRSINYAGSNQWALPTTTETNVTAGTFNLTNTVFGQLFYTELGGVAGNHMPNSDHFINVENFAYWLGTERVFPSSIAFLFSTFNGGQGDYEKNYGPGGGMFYVWAISPGQVATVPLPNAIWLFGSIFLGLLGLNRRNLRCHD